MLQIRYFAVTTTEQFSGAGMMQFTKLQELMEWMAKENAKGVSILIHEIRLG